MTTKQKIQANTEALRIVLENKSGIYTNKQIEAVKGFSGWGSCKQLVWSDGDIDTWKDASATDKALYPDYRKLYDMLDDNLTGREYRSALESMRNATMTSFYTPAVIPATFYQILNKYMLVESLYEPSAGMGVFITEAIKQWGQDVHINAYEKDKLTGKLLQATIKETAENSVVSIKGFEESEQTENNIFDVCVSNIPFGNFPVYDPACKDRNMTAKIHNYFFWKGIQKIKEGGVLAYLVTNAFLDTVTNKSAREWLFMNSDFVSLTVMPDNLMKESAGTEAGSHFLVVRKHTGKTEMSEEEKLLCVSERYNLPDEAKGTVVNVAQNRYIRLYGEELTIGDQKIGKDQYGKPAIETWWDKPIQDIAEPFREILSRDFNKRFINKGTISDPNYKILLRDPRQEQLDRQTEGIKYQIQDDLPNHIQVTEEEYRIEDEEEISANLEDGDKLHIAWGDRLDQKFNRENEGVQVDEFDENSTCLSDKDEAAKKAILHDFSNFGQRMDNMFKPRSEWDTDDVFEHTLPMNAHAGYTEVPIQIQLIPDELAQYNLKGKRERVVMKAAIKVIDCYKLLEDGE